MSINSKANKELIRILWRQKILGLPGGPEFLCLLLQDKALKEQDFGPHKFNPL